MKGARNQGFLGHKNQREVFTALTLNLLAPTTVGPRINP